MIYPSVNEVKEYLKEYRLVPVFYDFLSDTLTPVHIYNALSEGEKTALYLKVLAVRRNGVDIHLLE